MTCFHSKKNISTMINLIEASCGTAMKEGLRVYAMHLMELSERSSAILMVHKKEGMPFWIKGGASDSNQIVVAFETFEHLSKVSIRPTTAISPMNTMHEDIIAGAERKNVHMIIQPYHKHQRIDGHLETTRADPRHVNGRVLKHAPCSVGILVDKGFGGASHVSASNVDVKVTVLFFGGHDDREALAYGMRMAEHPGINLLVVRFLLDPEVAGGSVALDMDQTYNPKAQSKDEELLNDLKHKISINNSIKYEEKFVKDAVGTAELIHAYNRCNLFLVGRVSEGQVAAALDRKSDFPELGPLGNLLTCSRFSITASVLVVQQYQSELSQDSINSSKDGELTGGDSDSS